MEWTAHITNRIKAGDEQAFEEVFRTLYAPLCGYAHKILPDMADAEEVVQAVFLKVWEQRATLDIQHSIKAYLYRAVHNACLNQLKHEQVKQAHANHVKATREETHQTDRLEQQEMKREITRAINELPEKCREVFQLNRFEGLKYREVAELLGISEKTVENQMGKALKLLREKLAHIVRVIIPWVIFFWE